MTVFSKEIPKNGDQMITPRDKTAKLRRYRPGVTIASNIRFQDVSHHYGEKQTLKNVSLDIAPGEVVCLLGPSGSGKTTLLRLAAGLANLSSGSIFINNQEVSNPKGLIAPEKRGVGLVFQDFALFPHMNICKNVEFGLTQLNRSERTEHALRMLETVGLRKSAELYPNNLSGGEQQRVALARALAPKPGILLMDEPFSGLDARLRENVRDETLSLLRETRSTVLIVTHDPEEALKIGDRIVLMRDGELIQVGTCDDLYSRPNSLFSAQFFTELNSFDGIFDGRKICSIIGDFDLPQEYENATVGETFSVCVRPTDFRVEVGNADGIGRVKFKSNNALNETGDEQFHQAFAISRRMVGSVELVKAVIPGDNLVINLKLANDTLPQKTQWMEISAQKDRVMIFKTEQN